MLEYFQMKKVPAAIRPGNRPSSDVRLDTLSGTNVTSRGVLQRLQSKAALCIATCILTASATTALADHPKTAELLPDETVVFVRIPSIPDLIEKQMNSSGGKMLNDESIRPIFDQLYDSALEEYENIEDQVGLSMEELMSLPQGEFTFALTGEDDELAIVMFLDVGENSDQADTLFQSGKRLAENDGVGVSDEEVGDVSLKIIDGDDGPLCYFVREGLVCITNNPDTSRNILARWEGVAPGRGFDKNREFVTIMNRCRPVDGAEAQLQFFVDPIEITRINMSQTISGKLAYAVVPTMGLDGLAALGGSMTMDTPEFESVMHIHVMMTSPRKGVMNVIAMESGEVAPQTWVPHNASTYITLNWDVRQTYETILEQVDRFQGDGAARGAIEENFNEETGVDFEQELLDGITGRVTFVQWFVPPARVNSQASILGVEVKDPDDFQETVDSLFERATQDQGPDGIIGKQSYEGIEYIRVNTPSVEEQRERARERLIEAGRDPDEFPNTGPPFSVRTPRPCFGMIGETFVLTDSEEAFKACIDAHEDEDKSLQGDDDFARVQKQVRKLAGTQFPGGIMFSKPEESFRFMFGLAESDSIQDLIEQGRDSDNRAAQIFGDAMKDNQLPDVEDLVQYLAPGGGIITDDESGIHIILFGLQPENDE